MISIVVCSVNEVLFNKFRENVGLTIGVPHELIRVENSGKKYSICGAYNKGKGECKYDIICFCHEDVLFHTYNWGVILSCIFTDQKIGLVGVLGACYLSLFPIDWVDPNECEGQIMEGFKEGSPLMKLNRFGENPLAEVVAIDGVFMCTRKTIMDKINFSDDILKGFHGYDFDLSMQVRKYYKVVITRDILLLHLSSGVFNSSYFEAVKILAKKWEQHLPAYLPLYRKSEIMDLKIKSLSVFWDKSKTLKNKIISIIYAGKNGVLLPWLKKLYT